MVLKRSIFLSLWLWFEPVQVLKLPTIPYINILFQRWEEWLVDRLDFNYIEIVKAGINLFDLDYEETVHLLQEDIKQYNKFYDNKEKKEKSFFIEIEAAFWLHLLYQQDYRVRELEELLIQSDKINKRSLKQFVGLEYEEQFSINDQHNLFAQVSTFDYDVNYERRWLLHRVRAWAMIAKAQGMSKVILATASLNLIQWLFERINSQLMFNTCLYPQIDEILSLRLVSGNNFSCFLKQEALRLVLPNLDDLEETDLISIHNKLTVNGMLKKIRQRMLFLFNRLIQEPWSPELKQDLTDEGYDLVEFLKKNIVKFLPEIKEKFKTSNCFLSVLVIPGIKYSNLLLFLSGELDYRILDLKNQSIGSLPIVYIW